jgi:putative acetyltransferase
MEIRKIKKEDDPILAKIIKNTLAEFGAAKPGTVAFDPTTDHLSDLFSAPKSIYYVAEEDGKIFGGAGIFPTIGLPEDTCELVKMYLLKESRGKGLGKLLINKSIAFAKEQGFTKMYLETLPELESAVHVYRSLGFHSLPGPMGNSGHFGCSMWMIKDFDTTSQQK